MVTEKVEAALDPADRRCAHESGCGTKRR